MLAPPLRLVPQAGPAVWRGADLTPADWMLPLGAEAAAELEAGLGAAAAPPAMPRLAPLLRQAAERLETGRGFVLLRGLPIERLAATEGGAEAVMRLIAAPLGTALPQDAEGRTVLPAAGGGGTADGAPMRFQADPADAVLLLCLRQASEGGTVTLVSAPALHNALLRADRAALAALHEGLPQHLPGGGGTASVPVFATTGGAFAARCDHAAIETAALSGPQRAALAALEAAAAAPGQALTLALHPGDLLLRNPLLVWKRASSEAGPEVPEDARRALLRMWLSTPGARALPESFRPVFGAVEAGARRGGARPAAQGGGAPGGMVGG